MKDDAGISFFGTDLLIDDYRCPVCRKRGKFKDTSARWVGDTWEHRCEGRDPQSGCVRMEYKPKKR